jgi:uncharacterized peroxidase-related enzyme
MTQQSTYSLFSQVLNVPAPPLFTPIATSQGSPELQDSLRQTGATMEDLPNFLRLLANSPAAVKAYILADGALARGELLPVERELIALVVAEINNCCYSLSAHGAAARNLGLSEGEINQARRAIAQDPKTSALLRFAQAMVVQRGEVRTEDLHAVRQAGYSDRQIIEMIGNVGVNIFTNYFNNIANTEVDFPVIRPDDD